VSFDEILHVVELDQGLTARFLKLANSAIYRRREPIISIQVALIRVGLDEVCRTGLLYSVIQALGPIHTTHDPFDFWSHSLLTARLSARFAPNHHVNPAQAYLAGLMHDIGMLFLEQYFPEQFCELDMTSEELMYEGERRSFDTTHAELGFLLTQRWFSDGIIPTAIRYHHNADILPSNDKARPLADCIQSASTTASFAKSLFENRTDLDVMEFRFLREEYHMTCQIIAELIAKQKSTSARKDSTHSLASH
jgi:HD-like signal output (HDOD) protein